MLRDLTIRNYKLFRELSLPRLGDVNLIVGRNNTGKTVLLEALLLLASRGQPNRLFEVLWSRGEIVATDPESHSRGVSAAVRLEALFHGAPESLEGASFELINKDPGTVLRARGTRVPSVRTARGWRPVFEDSATAPEEQRMMIEVNCEEEQFHVDAVGSRPGLGPSRDPRGATFVAVGGLTDREVASWWDTLTLTDGEREVYECLQLLAPIERLSMVERSDASTRSAMVKLRGQDRPVPLRSLGDGVRRIFHFALALQRTRPGDMLLLDELENGVHYAALPELWAFLIKAARLRQVQVFATTHSWDCVLGFQQATAQEGASASLIKLYREQEEVSAVTFDEQELAVVAREEIEVR